jgi:hypothetical protein
MPSKQKQKFPPKFDKIWDVTPSLHTMSGASDFWAVRGGASVLIFVWGRRFPSRAPQTSPLKSNTTQTSILSV